MEDSYVVPHEVVDAVTVYIIRRLGARGDDVACYLSDALQEIWQVDSQKDPSGIRDRIAYLIVVGKLAALDAFLRDRLIKIGDQHFFNHTAEQYFVKHLPFNRQTEEMEGVLNAGYRFDDDLLEMIVYEGLRRQLLQMIDELPKDQRLVMTATMAGLEPREISQRYGLTTDRINYQKAVAIRALRGKTGAPETTLIRRFNLKEVINAVMDQVPPGQTAPIQITDLHIHVRKRLRVNRKRASYLLLTYLAERIEGFVRFVRRRGNQYIYEVDPRALATLAE